MSSNNPNNRPLKGRGATNSHDSRFNEHQRVAVDDGWHQDIEHAERQHKTHVDLETVKTIISTNQSPDVPFEQSINPYRGCEHGCIYCFARPTHAYLNLSPGLDFETQLTAKHNAASQLRQQLLAKNYQCKLINLGANTDPYQPIERQYTITRDILTTFNELNHPCTIITKSALIERDIDILTELAQKNLVQVNLSFTTLQSDLSRRLEPRASSPKRRLQTITALREANIPVNILLAPIIPVLTDPELETILQSVAQAGAQSANFILLRLPREVKQLFIDWLHQHYPDMAQHVINQIQDTRQGQYNDTRFEHRGRGEGVIADMIAQRFRLARQKYQLDQNLPALDHSLFHPHPTQISLF